MSVMEIDFAGLVVWQTVAFIPPNLKSGGTLNPTHSLTLESKSGASSSLPQFYAQVPPIFGLRPSFSGSLLRVRIAHWKIGGNYVKSIDCQVKNKGEVLLRV